MKAVIALALGLANSLLACLLAFLECRFCGQVTSDVWPLFEVSNFKTGRQNDTVDAGFCEQALKVAACVPSSQVRMASRVASFGDPGFCDGAEAARSL